MPIHRQVAIAGGLLAMLAAAPGLAQDREEEIVVATSTETETLASAIAYNANSRIVLGNVFEALVARDAKTNAFVPQLADSWEAVDPSTIRFTLREGVTFHDGTELTAEGAAAALAYVWSEENNFRLRTFMGPEMSFKAVDDMVLEVTTAEPDPILLGRLWQAYIPSPAQIENDPDSYLDTPIGTGPYKFVEWNQGTNTILEANDDWWGLDDEDGRGGIYFDRARFEYRPEAASRMAALQAGEVEIAERLPAEPCLDNLDDECVQAPDVQTSYLRLDAMNPVLGDARVRMAMSLSLDRKAIADLLGGAQPAAQIVGPSATGFNENLEPHPYDPEKARALIEEAKADGVPLDSTPLKMVSMRNAFTGNEDVLEIALESFRQIGLDTVEAEIIEKGQFIEVFIDPPRPIAEDRGLIALHKHGNNAFDYAAAVNVFYLCGKINSTSCNEKVDALHAESQKLSGEEREAAYEQIAKMLYDDNNIIPLHHLHRYHGVASRLDWEPRLDVQVLLKDIKPAASN